MRYLWHRDHRHRLKAETERRCRLAPAAMILVLLASASCSKEHGSPSAPTPSGPVTATFNLFSHTQGALGQVTRTVERGETIALRIADLGLSGVDPNHVIVRMPAANGRVGARVGVSPCVPETPVLGELCRSVGAQTPGSFQYQAFVDQTFDVFLLSTRAGTQYDGCVADALSKTRPAFRRPGGAFATVRLARSGEPLFDGEVAATPESDTAFRRAAEQYTQALNPFGMRFGQLDFVGSSAADITGGYVSAPALPWVGVTATSDFWIRQRNLNPADETTLQFGYETVFHELGHAFMGQPDQYVGPDRTSFRCRFPVEPFGEYSGWQDGWPALSDFQRDILAYWALLLA